MNRIFQRGIGAEHADRELTQRDDTRSRQRGDVDQRGRLESGRIGKAVGEDQAALGVRVLHFHGFARKGRDHVTRSHRPASGHVFRCREDADQD